ncbi:MAG: enoyl-CoA hydratase/isomerase family protein [Chloroflexota bacterium]|nr:MAG: enoyl-CoA hydratase/isomerase family protein [Chloroflexota bacterium]
MVFETLLYDKGDGIAVLTLNRPDSLNSVNTKMQAEMKEAWDDIEQDKNVRVVIITGGEKCFSAGADIREQFPPGVARPSSRDQFKKIEDFDRPSIAAISGYCLGGGLELALCCDLRIASETAQFGLVELRVGVVPGAGGMQRLPRTIGITKAKEMLYLAERIDAQEAYRIGLVNKVVPVASLMDEAKKMANVMLDMPPHGLKIAKECVNEGLQMDLQSALKFDVDTAAKEMATPLARENMAEGREAFAEKRKPIFKVE